MLPPPCGGRIDTHILDRNVKKSIKSWIYMRNTQSRGGAIQFRCQIPAATPKFRCRQADIIVFKYLIENNFHPKRVLIGGGKRFLPCS
jgi:hypothetical protein